MFSAAHPDDAPERAIAPARPAVADASRLPELFGAHFDFVWRSLRRLGLTADRADDAAQQVFMVLARKLAAVKPGSERSFLLGTAIRVASDIRKSAAYRREIAHEDVGVDLEGGARPDDLVERHRARILLDAALEAMDLDLRTVFVLFELEEMSTADIAAALGIPYGTVASRLRRAREEFDVAVTKLSRQKRRGHP